MNIKRRANLLENIAQDLESNTTIKDRVAEIRNLRTALQQFIDPNFKVKIEEEEAKYILKEVHLRLRDLAKDPMSCGKHGEINK